MSYILTLYYATERKNLNICVFDLFQAILNTVLDKHRAGIVVKQVAAGKEFSGCPFYSKPDIIHFKVSLYSKTSLARTLMARLPRIFRTRS